MSTSSTIPILCTFDDSGVIANNGRWGARYGPQTILNQLQKLNFAPKTGQFSKIESLPDKAEQLIHLGAGHNDLFPIMDHWLKNSSKKRLLINLDPHTDSRVDEQIHSGTPIAKLCQLYSQQLRVWQIGIETFANSTQTLDNAEKLSQKISWRHQWQANETQLRKWIQEETNEMDFDHVFISVDADVLSSAHMEAVSAVSYHGVGFELLRNTIQSCYQVFGQKVSLGIYEYNPLYENLSCKGAKQMALLCYDYLINCKQT